MPVSIISPGQQGGMLELQAWLAYSQREPLTLLHVLLQHRDCSGYYLRAFEGLAQMQVQHAILSGSSLPEVDLAVC